MQKLPTVGRPIYLKIPADVKSAWLDIGLRGKEERKAWETRFSSLPSAKQKQFNRVIAGDIAQKVFRYTEGF